MLGKHRQAATWNERRGRDKSRVARAQQLNVRLGAEPAQAQLLPDAAEQLEATWSVESTLISPAWV